MPAHRNQIARRVRRQSGNECGNGAHRTWDIFDEYGFYYMANAGVCSAGTTFSGRAFQTPGLQVCLCWSTAFLLAAAMISLGLAGQKEAVGLV